MKYFNHRFKDDLRRYLLKNRPKVITKDILLHCGWIQQQDRVNFKKVWHSMCQSVNCSTTHFLGVKAFLPSEQDCVHVEYDEMFM
jgi:hypothetical protein